tara:strand:+ start:489 stop:1040 length:552 start_codon:yes stop_codon:yes gene_type:complete
MGGTATDTASTSWHVYTPVKRHGPFCGDERPTGLTQLVVTLCEINSSLDSFKYNLDTMLAQVFDASASDCGVHIPAADDDSIDSGPDNCFGTGRCSTSVIAGLQCYNERGTSGVCTSFGKCYRFSMRVASCLSGTCTNTAPVACDHERANRRIWMRTSLPVSCQVDGAGHGRPFVVCWFSVSC